MSGTGQSWKGLQVFSEFLEELKKTYLDLIDKALERVKAEELGRDAAKLYRELVSGGVPAELAAELTREYFRARLEPVRLVEKLEELVLQERGGRVDAETMRILVQTVASMAAKRKKGLGGAAGEAEEAGGASGAGAGEA